MKGVLDTRAEKLNSSNWYFWKQTIVLELRVRGLWNIVQAPLPLVVRDNQKSEDDKARLVILQMLERSEFDRVSSATSAHELFTKLQENHEGAATLRKDRAAQEFHNFKRKENESLIDLIGRFSQILSRLLSTSYKVEDSAKFHIFIQALDDEWLQFADFWKMANRNAEFEEFLSALKMRVHQKESRKAKDKGKDNAAFVVDAKPEAVKTGSEKTLDLECNYCKQKGHMWRNCFKLKKAMTSKEGENSDAKKKKKPKEDTLKNKTKKKEDNTVAFMVNTGPTGCNHSETKWIADSAATRHMTFNLSLLTNYHEFETRYPIVTAGKMSYGLGSGDFCYNSDGVNGTLTNVWYLPGIPYNLLSTNRAQMSGFNVVADGMDQTLKITKNGQMVLIGRRYSNELGLVMFDLKPKMKTSEQALLGAPLPIWHKRFGHADSNTVKRLMASKAVHNLKIENEKSECTNCALGKIRRTNHPTTDKCLGSRESAVIHFDTAGPMKTESLGKSKYLVVAVDDYSNYKIVEAIKDKKEVKNVVKKIISYVELTR